MCTFALFVLITPIPAALISLPPPLTAQWLVDDYDFRSIAVCCHSEKNGGTDSGHHDAKDK